MANENEYPKIDGDILYGSEANAMRGFGDGTDGAFSETAGTTNLTQGTPYQYTTFLLDTSATLSASTTSTYPIIIYVQGNCTINGTIDLTGKGCAIGTGYSKTITAGDIDRSELPGIGTAGYADGDSGVSIGGLKGGFLTNFQQNQKSGVIMNGTGGGDSDGSGGGSDTSMGGGGGASSANGGTDGESASYVAGVHGVGGAGGCTILIIVGGTLTFGASSSIDVSGTDGADGERAGGGGGGAGDILIFHKGTKTDNGLTTDVTGGAKGDDTTDGNSDGGVGGAGTVKISAYDTILWF